MRFPFYKQLDAMDCGPTCLRMIAKYYGKSYSLQGLRSKSGIGRQGVSLLGISEAAENIGLKTLAAKVSMEKIKQQDVTPFIAYWQQNHFVIVYKMKGAKIYVADPGKSRMIYSDHEFSASWLSTNSSMTAEGIILLLEPTQAFYSNEDDRGGKLSLAILFRHLVAYKKLLFQLIIGLLIGSLLQLIFPFLTQAIVDIGINLKDLKFIYLLLLAQLMLFLGQTSVDFIRSWLLLHINTRINISILSDFLIKLMKLPISFFDSKMVGDIMQRIGDQQRIQNFLTGPALGTLFSFFNFFVFTTVIALYDIKLFVIFLIGTFAYFGWVLVFLRRRKSLDYKRFDLAARNQSKIIQLVNGMQEIKMNNCEVSKRWEWERIQAKLFRISVKGLTLVQYQQGGGFFINQVKNILVTFFSATAVVKGQLTLGSMLAIQYIIGQLNSPVEQFIQFIQSLQDALISLERLNEIHSMEDEEPAPGIDNGHEAGIDTLQYILPERRSLSLENLSFKYPGAGNMPVLENIDLFIPEGKTTAIVGASGSGKTTLLKLLMKFYVPTSGIIRLSETNLQSLSTKVWRRHCGAVLQDSFIFSDSIANNIAVSDEAPDNKKLLHAIKIANVSEFIESLPLGFNTKIGAEGIGLSQGQKQRILIARAVYKNPEYILFDEATNALDSNNEKIIIENLNEFFKGKTVVIVAHRLSTVKNADQIIVLDKGRIIEKGSHHQLAARKQAYFSLVKNQLELGE